MMVSTLRPPHRHHDKKKGKALKDALTNGHGKSKKRKEAPLKSDVAALYTEDIGMEGVKKARPNFGANGSPILKGPEGQKFQISETAEEKLRRLRRKARFDAGGRKKAPAPKTRTANLTSITMPTVRKTPTRKEPDFLSRALSSGRKDDGKASFGRNSQSQPHERLVGTNQDLEKPYLRLTTYPKAENVRPLEVLVKSLAHIKSKYYQEEDFQWANEQLKSVRQDITVQRLRGKFVLDVYETHARILLEHGDLSEFNQCQTMIRYLTTTGIESEDCGVLPGDVGSFKSTNDSEADDNEVLEQTEEASDEFRAYHVLYALVQNSWDDLTRALARVRYTIREKGEDSCKTASGRHALEVMKAVVHNDYRAFFKLYESAPHMSAYLMDFLVKRMREKAYDRIIAAYRPTICVEYFRGALYFQDLEETRLFLRQMGAKYVQGEPPFWVDCKASSASKKQA